MTAVRELADLYLADLATLNPALATYLGLPTGQHVLPDPSPEGAAAEADLAAVALRDVAALADEDLIDRRCRALMNDRLQLAVAQFESGEHLRQLGIMHGTPAGLRSLFDLMPRDTDEQWEAIGARMAAFPAALDGLRRSLEEGLQRRIVAAPRQAMGSANQLLQWSGDNGHDPFFAGLAAAAADVPDTLRRSLDAGATAAGSAMGELAGWLRDTYVPAVADVSDAVGHDRYVVNARSFLGANLDPDDAYAWAWEELARIEADMSTTADRIVPGGSIAEALEWLDHHGEALDGEDALIHFLQDLMDRTIDDLDGTHFELAPPLRIVEAMIDPPGGAAAQHYTPPSADFSRPGRVWNPTMGKTRFPVWSEVSTSYHEAVPGHHLQLAQWVYMAPSTSLFQSTFFVSGNGEGWALYAERLMEELGYLEDPGRRMGYLVAQQLRATRIIVDIGMHLEMPIPRDQPFHPGERFTPALGREFMGEHAGRDAVFLDSEWERYLGWPGQAICYKLGERVWLAGREAAQRRAAREGRQFDLRAWHMAALSMGSTGLDYLATELEGL